MCKIYFERSDYFETANSHLNDYRRTQLGSGWFLQLQPCFQHFRCKPRNYIPYYLCTGGTCLNYRNYFPVQRRTPASRINKKLPGRNSRSGSFCFTMYSAARPAVFPPAQHPLPPLQVLSLQSPEPLQLRADVSPDPCRSF